MIPYDKRSGKIWYNNELVDWAEVKLHVLSHGMHYASCVFEGERVYAGRVFRLREHTQRLIDSATALGFTIPYSLEEIEQATIETVAAQGYADAYVRPVAWRGSEMMGVSAQIAKIIFAIAVWLATRYIGRLYVFWTVLAGYAAMRFGLQFLRIDQPPHFLDLQQSQIISLLVLLTFGLWLTNCLRTRLWHQKPNA